MKKKFLEMNIPYRDRVYDIAQLSSEEPILFQDYKVPNFDRSHASALIDVLFATAKKRVDIYTGELKFSGSGSEKGIWGFKTIIQAVRSFLYDKTTTVRILMAKPQTEEKLVEAHPLIRSLREAVTTNEYHGGRIQISNATGDYQHMEGGENKPHFCCNDVGGYRLELSDNFAKAEANFAGNKHYNQLISDFNGAFEQAEIVIDAHVDKNKPFC